jgi:hypothetical protein
MFTTSQPALNPCNYVVTEIMTQVYTKLLTQNQIITNHLNFGRYFVGHLHFYHTVTHSNSHIIKSMLQSFLSMPAIC